MDRIPSALIQRPYLAIQQAIYIGSRGWIGRWLTGTAPALLLTTTGRKSGLMRTNALIYVKDGNDWLVVPSNGGSDRTPGWLANLRADPHVVVQVARRKVAATARTASPEERERLWPLVNKHNRGLAPLFHWGARGRYDVYQRHTSRTIDVVILTPEATVGA
jgi:deazaflavin-dependent oxidoreductase (nitroreductase family)